jgi:hypothetical protein
MDNDNHHGHLVNCDEVMDNRDTCSITHPYLYTVALRHHANISNPKVEHNFDQHSQYSEGNELCDPYRKDTTNDSNSNEGVLMKNNVSTIQHYQEKHTTYSNTVSNTITVTTEAETACAVQHNVSTDNLNVEFDLISENIHARQNEGLNMPPLCSNNVANTPTLSLQFSPLINFSEDRMTDNSHDALKENYTDESKETEPNSAIKDADAIREVKVQRENDRLLIKIESPPQSVLSESKEYNTSRNTELTYADNLLLNASKTRSIASLPPTCPSSATSNKVKKRKANCVPGSSRQPQKRFSNNNSAEGIFFNKSDGRVPLTTNVSRPIEASNLKTGVTSQFASCSEASRKTGINRTRMSRCK